MRSDQIEIKLMTWGSIKITLDELIVALRHRLVVITYFVCWAVIYPFRFRPDVPQLDVWREVIIFLIAQAVVILSLPLTVAIAARPQDRAKGPAAVYLSPVVFCGTILGCISMVLAYWFFTGVLEFDFLTMFIYALLQIVFAELVGSLVMTLFLQTILSDLRGPAHSNQTAGTAAPDDAPSPGNPPRANPSPVSESAPASDPALLPAPSEVVLAGRRMPKQSVRYVRSAGNYLDVVLRTEKLFVQATMRSFLQQTEVSDGVLLHRSLWLARDEVKTYQRQAMDIFVQTADGEQVKTARSRQSEVLAWLKLNGIRRVDGKA